MNLGVAAKAAGRNPHSIICYICGREYGTKSIDIHEKNCLDKWKAYQSTLPKNKRLAIPTKPSPSDLPPLPDGNDAPISSSGNYNDLAFQAYSEQSRAECPVCGRKFAQDRLVVHARSCYPGGIFDKKSKKATESNQEKPKEVAVQKPIMSKPKVEKPIKDPSKSTETLPVKQQFQSPVKINQSEENATKVASFCSECGLKFGTADKFCVDCGVKRLGM